MGNPRCVYSPGNGQPTYSAAIRVEATRCADVGPLFVRRTMFRAVNGYNETGTKRGEPASVRVDCELQARMWLAGFATLNVGFAKDSERWQSPAGQHEIWAKPGMAAGHLARQVDYYHRFETAGSSARLKIEGAARDTNRIFECPRSRLRLHPATKMDCCIVPCESSMPPGGMLPGLKLDGIGSHW